MSESAPSGTAEAVAVRSVDPRGMIDSLRARGSDRFDPVRFRFLEALARRADAHQGSARRILDSRLAGALDEYQARLARATAAAGESLERSAAQFPESAGALAPIHRTGDFRALRQAVARLEGRGRDRSLGELLAHIAQHSREDAGGAGGRRELKSTAYFRKTWAQLNTAQQLSRALAQGPENPGPLNSHLLVLQSLELMRDISPAYLGRFIAYADALLWLDQADNGGRTAQKNVVRTERDKQRKSGRSRSS